MADFLETIVSNFTKTVDLRNFAALTGTLRGDSPWSVEDNRLFYLDELIVKMTFHPNKVKETEKTFHNGVSDGPFKRWHRNVKKSVDTNLYDGQYDGPFTSWTPNGQLHSQGFHLFGKKEGFWSYWWGNGHRNSEGNYIDGREYGTWHFWDENGGNQQAVEFV